MQTAALFIGATALTVIAASSAYPQGDIRIWGELQDSVAAIQEVDRRLPGLPEDAMLSEDKWDAQETIRSLMREAFAILASSEASRTLSRYHALEEEIRQQVQEASEAELAQLGAPETNDGLDEALSYVWGSKTKADYAKKVAAASERIRVAKLEQSALKRELLDQLRSLGIDVPDGSIDSLVASAAKDEMVNLASAYANVAAITEALRRSTLSSSERLEIARRYYGIYTVLLRMLIAMQFDVENRIENIYVKKIDEISEQTTTLLDETMSQLRDITVPEHKSNLEANIEAQRLTLQAAAVYREHLIAQLHAVRDARRQAEAALAVAANTEKTVNISADLTSLMRQSADEINAILGIKPPPLQPFQSLELKREFEALSERIEPPGS